MQDASFDLKYFYDLLCAAGLAEKPVAEMSKEEVQELLSCAFKCTTIDRVPF